jgi:hypothetical protein
MEINTIHISPHYCQLLPCIRNGTHRPLRGFKVLSQLLCWDIQKWQWAHCRFEEANIRDTYHSFHDRIESGSSQYGKTRRFTLFVTRRAYPC